MNTRSLRFQLLVWYTTLLIAAFAVIGVILNFAVKQVVLQNLRDLLDRRVRQIAHIIDEHNRPLSADWLKQEIQSLYAPETPESNGRFVRVTDARNGAVIYLSGVPINNIFDPEKVPPINLKESRPFRFELEDDQRIIIKMGRKETRRGPVLIEVGGAMKPIRESVRHVLLSLSLATPALVAVAAIGAYILIGRALKPVVRITRSAEEISLQNLGEKLPVVHSGDELETLSLALNRMIKRLHDSVETTRRFVADASHELRTPLAVLRGELENVMSQDNLSTEARERVASNLEEVERLAKIVQGLFALSRLDCGEAQAESTVFDLAKVVSTTTEQMCLLAEDKGVTLESRSLSPTLVRGDPARIKQVIVNLVDNAINYTPEGGRVEVKTSRANSHAVLEVTDTGIGIPEEASTKIFERFYRVDPARSRDLGGAGLGLSIVKSICTAHGGEIFLESKMGKGSRFTIQFPLAEYPTVASGGHKKGA
jgi:two-component system, OmpR family, sensor kinase